MDLWSKKGLKYSIEHARAKLAMLGGEASPEEEERQVDDGDLLFENPENSFKITDHNGAHILSDKFI